MIDELQEIVESLARRIGHTVYVDDSEFRTLAYSSHLEEPDAARLSALVSRELTEPMREYLDRLGVRSWRTAATLEADPAMGIEYPRLCLPLRSRYGALGYMWINVRRELDESGRAEAVAVAERLAGLLAQHAERLDADDAARADLVRELVAGGGAAAARLRSLGMFADVTHVVTIVGRDGAPDGIRRAVPILRRAIASATALRPRSTVGWAIDAEAAIVLGYRAAPPTGDAGAVARAIHRELAALDGDVAAAVRWGVGGSRADLADAALSAEQARVAARIAAGRCEPVAAWDDDPIAAMLGAWRAAAPGEHLVPEPIRRLPETQSPDALALVRAFLDHAGNVATVATALHLHRTTVYERLRRFEETTGLELRSGAVRLALHLWLLTRG